MGQMTSAYNILIGKPEGKRHLEADGKINTVGRCGLDACG
jgi:hypothetical protein